MTSLNQETIVYRYITQTILKQWMGVQFFKHLIKIGMFLNYDIFTSNTSGDITEKDSLGKQIKWAIMPNKSKKFRNQRRGCKTIYYWDFRSD